MRAEHGDAVATPRKHVGGGRAARHIARARHGKAAVGTLSAAEPELGNGATLCSLHHTRGLSGRERLEADDVQERRLEQLALERRAAHAHHGLAREHELALGHGIDVHARAEVGEIAEEPALKERTAARSLEPCQVIDVIGRKAQVLDEFRQLSRTAHHGIGAPERVVAIERGETSLLVELAALPQPLGHGELVEIGEHSDVGGF